MYLLAYLYEQDMNHITDKQGNNILFHSIAEAKSFRAMNDLSNINQYDINRLSTINGEKTLKNCWIQVQE